MLGRCVRKSNISLFCLQYYYLILCVIMLQRMVFCSLMLNKFSWAHSLVTETLKDNTVREATEYESRHLPLSQLSRHLISFSDFQWKTNRNIPYVVSHKWRSLLILVSWDSTVNTVTGCQLDDRDSISSRGRNFFCSTPRGLCGSPNPPIERVGGGAQE